MDRAAIVAARQTEVVPRVPRNQSVAYRSQSIQYGEWRVHMEDKIERTVDLKAPIQRVWRAITDHEEFGTWFRVKLDGPFRVGQTTTGQITYEGYEHLKWISTVERMDAPHQFVFTWPNPENADDEQELSSAPEMRVEFRLNEITGGTRLTIIESGFSALPANRRAKAMQENEGGWDIQVGNIQSYVES